MGTPFKPGVPAIQVLQSDLVTVDRTVYLPTPTTVKLDWKEKAIRQELVSGAERIRRIGYVPVLTMAWKTYQDVNEERYPLGNANGNTLRLQDLLDICNLGGGRLRVSPGPGAGETYSVTAHGFGVGNGSTTAFQLQQAAGRRESYGWQGYLNVPNVPRTNILLYSEQFDNGATTKLAASVTANAITAPDGTLTADFIKEDNTTNSHGGYQLVSNTQASTFTATRYFKAGTRTKVNWGLTTQSETSRIYATFDLTLGAIIGAPTVAGTAILSAPSASMEQVPNQPGWWKCKVTGVANGTQTAMGEFVRMVNAGGSSSYLGDNVSGLYTWGGGVDPSGQDGPYIPTTSAAVTVNPAYWPTLGDGFDPVYALSGSPSIYVAGVLKTVGTDYTLSTTGLVTFTVAPASGAALTWSGSFTGPRKAFRGFVTKAPNLRPVGPSIATDVEVEFTGYDVFSSPTLENF